MSLCVVGLEQHNAPELSNDGSVLHLHCLIQWPRSHMWLLNLSLLRFIKRKIQSLSLTSQISSPQESHDASGCHIGQCGRRAFLSWQEVPWAVQVSGGEAWTPQGVEWVWMDHRSAAVEEGSAESTTLLPCSTASCLDSRNSPSSVFIQPPAFRRLGSPGARRTSLKQTWGAAVPWPRGSPAPGGKTLTLVGRCGPAWASPWLL